MKVTLLAHTPDAEKLITQAAKLCYSAVGIEELGNNLTGEEIAKFLDRLASMGHESPLEHISFTFGIEGISRVCSHQLVRHRIASYSQQSQRYVRLDQFEYIIPPSIAENPVARAIFIREMENDQKAYDELVDRLITDGVFRELGYIGETYENLPKMSSISLTRREIIDDFRTNNRKKFMAIEKTAIEDARFVFPNACETKIVVTMNARTLLNFFHHRCCDRAQWEIRAVAWQMLKLVKIIAPRIFKFAGPHCAAKPCPEGAMSCGRPKRVIA